MLLTSLTILIVMLAFFSLGIYVAVALGITALAAGWASYGLSIIQLFGHVPWNVVSSSTITVVPLFFIMGEILVKSGITDDMYEAIYAWLSRLPGGMLYTNIGACGMFASISGSSIATAQTIGSVALPAMVRRGYNEKITLGSITAGGTLGILIPPSITFIVYGLLAEVSIGQLYIAAVIPGVIMTLSFSALIFFGCLISPQLVPRSEKRFGSLKDKIRSLVSLIPIILLFLLVVGTIYAGIATAVESAAFGAVGAFILALIKRKVNITMLKEVFLNTAKNTAMMIFILIGAFLLQFVFAFIGLPNALSEWVISLGLSPLMLVVCICLIYFMLGMFIETLAMLVTTIPIIMPIVDSMNIDPIWFGVIVTIMCELSLITPPVGMNLFVVQGVRRQVLESKGEKPITDVYFGSIPFVAFQGLVLIIIIAFPKITTFLLR